MKSHTIHDTTTGPREGKANTSSETPAETFFRRWAPPIVLFGVGFWGLFAGGFVAYYSLHDRFVVRIVEEHYPGVILVPLSALTALCIVLLLRWTSGALELDLGGQVRLRGASGPLTLWIICFLAIVFAIWLLWPLSSAPNGDVREPGQISEGK